MKKFIVLALTSVLACYATAGTTTAERHMNRGAQCASCHISADKTMPVRKEACLKCHQSYSAVAALTKNDTPNPHFSHYGDRDCSVCHKGHQTSVLICNQCHKFDLKTP